MVLNNKKCGPGYSKNKTKILSHYATILEFGFRKNSLGLKIRILRVQWNFLNSYCNQGITIKYKLLCIDYIVIKVYNMDRKIKFQNKLSKIGRNYKSTLGLIE